MQNTRVLLWFLAITTLLLVACGSSTSGSGSSNSTVSVPNYNSAPPSSGIGSIRVLDLPTGAVTDFDENYNMALLGVDQVAFRLVNNTEALIGSRPGSLGNTNDEPYRVVTLNAYYLSVTEITQSQWQALSGNSPWTALGPSAAVGAVVNDPQLPAVGMTANEAIADIATYNGTLTGFEIDLPSQEQWEAACRGGSSTPYGWGTDESVATIGLYAIVQETRPNIGVQLVGQRLRNNYGFFDMHGNAAELVQGTGSGGTAILRGGSWSDIVLHSRSGNRQYIDPDVPHAIIGLRLVLRQTL